jgi:hypothetical protein
MEDFVMFYGYDGYVYAFLAAGPRYEFRSIYLVRGSDIYFHNLTVIGKILDNPKSVWEDIRIRPRSVVYDNENERYLLYYDGMGSIINFGCGVLTCKRSDFPNGPWVESSQNPILDPAIGQEGLMVIKKYGTYMGIYSERWPPYKICISDDPLAKFTTIATPVFRGTISGQIRGFIEVDGGYLIAYEWFTGKWQIGLAFLDQSLTYIVNHQNTPTLTATEPYEGSDVANPYLSETSDMMLMYYNSWPNGSVNVVLAYTPKP